MAKQTIRILVAIFLVKIAGCQDGFSNEDFLRLQQYSLNDAQADILNNPSLSSVNSQYHLGDNNNGDYIRSDRGRVRKVYRIKNPFQQQEDDKSSHDNYVPIDSSTGASNQYAAMQYSLPPEDFLQKMKNENQYHQQQQQQQQQLSTQMTALPYTATPQPQYQYSTLPASNYDQQSNQISTTEPKSYTPTYQSNSNSYQYNPYMYNVEAPQSTPIPPYLTTPIPSPQYIDTSANTYVSSSSPIYLSSPQNFQQYVSSPMSNIQTGTVEYNNRVTTLANNYERPNDLSKSMQIDHYDNSANGIRYPMHIQNQYHTDFISSTISPNTSIYPEHLHSHWQTPVSSALNALPKSEMYAQKNYQIFKYNNNQHSNHQDTITDLSNSDTHRNGNIPAANNLYFNYAQPEYQVYNKIRDFEQDTSQSDVYSHGDYGWKLSEKKSSLEPEISTKNNYFKYQIHSVQPETGAISQINFQMDSSKPYGYDQNTKPVTEKLDAEEFAKAAAKAHENYKQQIEANKYFTTNYNSNSLQNPFSHTFYNNDKQRTKQYNDNTEAATVGPVTYRQREILDTRQKLPFDHEKALKNIVPIDVSNVVQNSDSSSKLSADSDSSNKYNNFAYYKELAEQAQAQKQYLRHAMDSYYKDRNTLYSIKSKPEDFKDKIKQFEQSYVKHQAPTYSNGLESGDKRFGDEYTHTSLNFANQIASNPYDNIQPPSNSHPQSSTSPQSSDITDLLKFNDIPYRLTQSYSSEFQRNRNSNYEQSSLPTPLPARVNQNVQNHHIDVAAEILNKLMSQKQSSPSFNRPESNPQSSLLPTINGFKVANPYNVDLKLVEDMLKGKPTVDDSRMTSLRSDLHNPLSMKFDVSQLQQLFQPKNDNNGMLLNNGLINPFTNSLYDIYNSGRFPYQGVKYSRSEEEPETIPIADSSNNHPIGAVVEEDEANTDLSDIAETNEELNLSDDRYKNVYNSSHRSISERHKYPSITYSNRHSYKRKYPKSEFDEPYPLLKPPPPHNSRHRTVHKGDKMIHRRRVVKPKMLRIYKTEPLFEAGASLNDDMGPIKRSLSVTEEEVDIKDEKSV